ncbi:SGNH/GDSL hydrolase family protein [Modestobacter sp. I12A-02628]|uniref:SGNH/GDSL hydrolase family protein n=1 Tax=Goekera deserti TaxID=2497753 RepID=A0A7K3WF42_9ACTN|nr:SGNH/GDSL hydrolase family protein [Goekera deserti]MPQ97921.1 SGNH/GDSL hydrolase family protein [Goekera deserti]NDI48567.1 SGNH/GDSL hydrolase family protein [Goekera deserti]NEL55054.1 SGNH/GDSL hydrolase family protein [Goekera deserti]
MSRGFERPPIWFWALMVIAGLAAIATVPVATSRGGDPISRAESDRLAAAAASADREDAVAAPISVLVVGDSYTGGSNEGGVGAKSWTAALGRQLREAGYSVDLSTSAGGGAGYTVGGSRGLTFQQLAEEGGVGFDLVVVFGSRNDLGDSDAVESAAQATYETVRANSPNARLLVVEPPWVDADVPNSILEDRDGVAAAAAAAGAAFLDPLAGGWFTGPASDLIGDDGVHPDDAGHAYMAELMQPAVVAELDAIRAAR